MDIKQLQSLRNDMDFDIPVIVHNKMQEDDYASDWHEEYWNSVGALLGLGGYMFIWGLVFAIVVAGAGLIIGAVLLWACAFLMAVTYPIWVAFGWIGSLFKRK